jgi:hypothetical protein
MALNVVGSLAILIEIKFENNNENNHKSLDNPKKWCIVCLLSKKEFSISHKAKET